MKSFFCLAFLRWKERKSQKSFFFFFIHGSYHPQICFFVGVKKHESKCDAYLNRGGHKQLHVRISKKCVLLFYKYFQLISVIYNIRKHIHHFPCEGFFKPCPSAGPEVVISKTCAAEYGRAGRQPFLGVCYFLNAILDKVFLKITLHSFRFIVKIPPSNCFYQQTKRSH